MLSFLYSTAEKKKKENDRDEKFHSSILLPLDETRMERNKRSSKSKI